MALIESSVTISAPADIVWKIVSDVDSEPKYWKGTKSVKNISRDGNTIHREVVIAFRDKRCKQRVEIIPNECIKITFTEGIIIGTKTIMIRTVDSQLVLETVWDIKISGMLGMFTGMLTKHIRGGTEQALNAIKKDAEDACSQ
ncbi:MAG: Cyclase/dehydrase [Cenarchaeum symbiont of Oopsacas minuta]|nr:Cyclase/dehydrase [Cenarchaeum symbiont of Oopsacas minuta]